MNNTNHEQQGLLLPSRLLDMVIYGTICSYFIYCLIIIAQTSVVIKGIRYFTLFDDAMISMRYARNLVHGYGLVFNPGERVEGYTNLLWTLYMAFWHLIPIGSAKISLPIQLTGLIFLISSLFLTRKIAYDISEGNRIVSIGSVLITAAYQPITYYALKGMETSALGFIVLLAVWRIISSLNTEKFDISVWILLGIGMLLRIDFAFSFIVFAVLIIAILPRQRTKNMLYAMTVFSLVLIGETLFRYLYYNSLFPNTYYAKMTGVSAVLRVKTGLWQALAFIEGLSPFMFTLFIIYSLLQLRNKKIIILSCLFFAALFYSIYVGGDVWEDWGHLANRFLCPVMPLFFISISLMIWNIINGIKGRLNTPRYSSLKIVAVIMLILVTIVQSHSGFGKQLISQLIKPEWIDVEGDKKLVKFALELKRITNPEARIAVVTAGAIPYFSERYCIDLLGKTDAVIAHEKARISYWRDFCPGHNKYDYRYSLGELKPDIVAQLWMNADEAQSYLKDYEKMRLIYYIYCRKNSPNIYWNKICGRY